LLIDRAIKTTSSSFLSVDDSLDDLLELTTKKTKAKPISKQTMPLTKPGSHSQTETEDSLGVESMDDTDIARYIEQEQNADSDIDLFS